MSRATNREVMGFFAIGEKHHEAILSLIEPSPYPDGRILDPFAGEGDFLLKASKTWQLAPYANELDKARAEACVQKFGSENAVQGDVMRLSASLESFSVGWYNPPYDNDKLADTDETPEAKRVEYRYLRHAWKWIQQGGIVMWVVYRHHITESATTFLSRHSARVDIWGLEGKHLHEYDQIIVVAIKGKHSNPQVLYDHIMATKDDPHPLPILEKPVYQIPPPPTIARFTFAPDEVTPELGLKLIQERGAHLSARFNALFAIPPTDEQIETIVPPRPGHMAYVLAGAATSGIVMETETYGKVAMRSVVKHVEERSDAVITQSGSEQVTITSKPKASITLLTQTGSIVNLAGDDDLLNFIVTNKDRLIEFVKSRFTPLYEFDYAGFGRILDGIALVKGDKRYPLFTPQKHVIGAILKGFEERRGIFLVGQMSTGKTLMGGTVASVIGSGAHPTFRKHISQGGVVVIVCPPHLVSKWKREILGINPNCIIHQVNRHEDMKAFMNVPHKLGYPKIAIIKRDMTKLGSGWRESVVWRNHPYALWQKDGTPPIGTSENTKRVYTVEKPHCPHCHHVLTGDEDTRTKEEFITYLGASKRECPQCHSPLWQEIRPDKTPTYQQVAQEWRNITRRRLVMSDNPLPAIFIRKPKRRIVPIQRPVIAPQNPRYRLDQYIKKRYRRDIALLIWDEVHEAQHSDTGNGEAFGRLANCARATLAMTGTPFNGYASSLFNLEYILNPRVRRDYYWGGGVRYTRKRKGSKDFPATQPNGDKTTRGQQESRWVAQMGVRERVETTVKNISSAGKLTGTETYVRPYEETSGISPMLVSTMLDHTIYFSLSDLKKHLPMYSETTYSVDMDASMESEYEDVVKKLLDCLIAQKNESAKAKDHTILPKYLQFTMGWVNAPWRDYRIHDKWGTEIARALPQDYQPSDMSDEDWFLYGGDELSPKEEAFVEYIKDELEDGRPCIVYCRQTQKNDIQIRLQHLIQTHVNANTYILRSNINAERREAVIDKQIGQGMEILICNPEIVKTGLDLVFAPTILFYEPTFNLSTMMQAAARSYRLNQTFPLCRVVYMYYRGTMEERAILLMSKKQRSSKLLTGDTGLSGLDALTEKEDKFESVLMNSIGKDARLEAPDFTQENSRYAEFDNADLAYWNVETVTPPTETAIRVEQVLSIAQKAVEQVIAMRGISAPKPAHYNPSRETVLGSDGDKTIVQLRLF